MASIDRRRDVDFVSATDRFNPKVSMKHRHVVEEQQEPESATVLDPRFAQRVRRRVHACRKADFLEVLNEPKLLRKIPLSPHCDVPTAQAFRDAVREDIVLNGVQFAGEHRTEAFVAAVKRIVEKSVLLRRLESRDCIMSRYVPKSRALLVSDRVMRSCSRTHSGADSYFALEQLFGHPDLLIKPRPGCLPLHVNLGVDRNGVVKCKISVANLYGIYRHDDIERMVHDKTFVLEPLVLVDTVIVESIDFSSGETTRLLSLRSPEPEHDVHAELRELF
ncbi:unnamed protein product [Aphanomyces euteiches]|uniref:Uncharacterized protein n=1 Tax=Aphanomyces euteiches TaxID=100861 RepID=A0A6G0WX74_9STRA|nr:hypothetical protein Ae201684_010752 [Aphanomyces euteiches]KAH9155680.1 hypothetical protein AeRB84_002371 [Aphanomyces euteiches]